MSSVTIGEGGVPAERGLTITVVELTTSDRDSLFRMMSERKKPMREDTRRRLARMGSEGYADLLSGTSDVSDETVATLLSDVANTEAARDSADLLDIAAAEFRIAAGTYGQCTDCGAPILFALLATHPTAKRCLGCQQIREATRTPAGRS